MNNGKGDIERIHRDGISQEPTFQDYVQIVLRGKWMILASFLLVLAGTAVFTFTTSPVYESTATVLVDTKGQQSQMPLFDVTGIGAVKNIKNELEILKSRSLAEAVAVRLIKRGYTDSTNSERILIIWDRAESGPEDILLTASEIAKRLMTAVEFEPIRDSDVIKVTARSVQPKEAALIANTFAEAYYDRNLFSSRSRSRAAREFLDTQLKVRKSSLDESEGTLQKYMEQKGIVSLDDEAKKVIDQLATLEAQRDAADIELQALSKTLTSYQEELAKQEPNVAKAIGEANDPYIRLLQEQLAMLEVRRDVTVAQNPTYVGQDIYTQKLKEIDNQINALREKLRKRTEEFLLSLLPGQRSTGSSNDPASFLSEAKQKIIETQIQIQSLQSKKDALQVVLTQYERHFESIPQKSIQYARLQRARLSSEKLYLLVEEKFNEASIKEKSEFGYIFVIDPAIVPLAPVSPKVRLNLLLGAILGLGLGIGFVFLREYIDVRARTPEDLKKRGYSTLTAIALMDEEIQKLGGKTKIERDGRLVDAHLLSFVNPLSSIAESYRRLRTNVQYAQLDEPLQSIMVTSANPGEGKSTTVSNLATTFAQTGKKIVLLDTDLRKPSLHAKFGLDRDPGLTDLLLGNATLESVLRKTPVEGLDIIPSGSIPPNPSEMLGSQKMKELIKRLKERYDILMFDSPPVLAVTDPVVLSTLVDGVIVVVSSGHTRMDAVDRTVELIQNVGAKSLGLVLNNFDLRLAYGGYYGYYRYKYYSYGYGYSYGQGPNGEEKKRKKAKPVV